MMSQPREQMTVSFRAVVSGRLARRECALITTGEPSSGSVTGDAPYARGRCAADREILSSTHAVHMDRRGGRRPYF